MYKPALHWYMVILVILVMRDEPGMKFYTGLKEVWNLYILMNTVGLNNKGHLKHILQLYTTVYSNINLNIYPKSE